ncbi:MAG TPA: DUF4476 domain-containing protein [Cytophagaceae bacterium]|nr:DUF4476 domain-containing protein [Cytophagaceae bacterium]
MKNFDFFLPILICYLFFLSFTGNAQTSKKRVVKDTTDSTVLCKNGQMSEEDFDKMKELINTVAFTESKLGVLQETMPGHCINTVQIKEILSKLSFEMDKLDVAKYLYKFTSDKQNYSSLNDQFSFPSNIEELTNYIKTVK